MTSSLKMVVVQADLDGEGLREALGAIREVFAPRGGERAGTPAPAALLPNGVPANGTPALIGSAVPAASDAAADHADTDRPRKPRRKYQRRVKQAAVAQTPKPKRKYTRRSQGADARANDATPAREPKTTLADRIAHLLDRYGPLPQQRLAVLLASSEKSVGLALGHAKDRFAFDAGLGQWTLADASSSSEETGGDEDAADETAEASETAHPLEERLANLIRETGPQSAGDAARLLHSHHKTVYACIEASDRFALDADQRICLEK